MARAAAFEVDEEPLRLWVLKAYQERRGRDPTEGEVLEALRRFLSGPRGGPCVPGQYFFETDPEACVWRFLGELESAVRGLAVHTAAPLLEAVRSRRPDLTSPLAPNLSVFIASMAGPIALKTRLDETLVCGVLSALLLALSKLGSAEVESALERLRHLGGD